MILGIKRVPILAVNSDRRKQTLEILRCEGVRKTYGSGGNQAVALEGIDLIVEKGEFVTIIGASGSGKSTLLHILGSVDKPSAGKVLIGAAVVAVAGAAIVNTVTGGSKHGGDDHE